jgi:hypothetical protein
LLEFRKNTGDFTRNRLLTLEHVMGLTLSLAATRNANGYDISSQNYFRDLGKRLGEKIDPAKHQSISEARSKLGWEAFEFLFHEANIESADLPERFKFKGHLTRAIDGTSFFTPRSKSLLEHFSLRKTKSEEGETHYPYGLLVTAINVYTGQPVHAVVDDYRMSERKLLRKMIADFNPGDLSLLDRGLGGGVTYLDYSIQKQFFIHRSKTSGDRVAGYIQKFLASGKKQKLIELKVKDPETSEDITLSLRLILGPIDSEGKPIVFVTNLIDKKHYSRREIIALYQKRWSVETLYHRSKKLLALEKFHARSYNGVMQEIFANLLILSLTALAVTSVVVEDKINIEVQLPNFKNASESVRRHLFSVVDQRIDGIKPKKLMKQILDEVRAVMYPIRPGRSYPRVSMQPIQSWNLKKSAKLKAFATRQKNKGGAPA